MSQTQLHEHRGYLGDEQKLEAYRAALAEVVTASDRVLDLGAGTGVLGYLALAVGAAEVIAVDRGEIVELARQIARDNGFEDRVTHVHALSTEMSLDQRADVIVCDQIGGLVHDAGILRCFADASRRLLAPGGHLVPSSFEVFMAPVTFEVGRDEVDFWSTPHGGLDFSAAHRYSTNTEWNFRLSGDDVVALADGRSLASFASNHDEPIAGSATFEAETGGRFDGYVGWFEAQMSPSVTLTNDPWSADRFERWCNFYPLGEAVDVAAGSRIELDLDLRPRLELVSWSTRVTGPDGEAVCTDRRSSFNGSFVSATTIDGLMVDRPIQAGDRAEVAAEVLGLIDGTTSQNDIVDALSHRIGTSFLSRPQLERFVKSVADLLDG